MIKNSREAYGVVSKVFHWLSALTVIGLFGLGWWMVELGYYDPWYQRAPNIHKSIGILLLILILCRLVWSLVQIKPQPLSSHKPWEQRSSYWVHKLLYLLIFTVMISGYLISTADNRGIVVFNWFEVPSMGTLIPQQEDIAGLVHEWVAYSLIGLVIVHALAAIKHHFIDRDNTLRRIL